MIQNIFDIDGTDVVLSPNILLIPEYRDLYNEYRDLNYFSHIYFMYHPESPYNSSSYSEQDKENKINEAFPNVDTECPYYVIARDLFVEQSKTPSKVIYEALKIAAQKMSTFFITQQVSDGKDGNIAQFKQFVKEGAAIMKAANQTENAYREEIQSARGNEEITADEDMDYDN